MLYFDLPPTRDRYVAEVRNLLAFHCKPFCIVGPPRASVWELQREIGGARLGRRCLVVGWSLVRLKSRYTVIESM